MVPAFEKLSLAGNTDTEQVISGVSVMQEKFRSFWETAIYNVWYPRRFSGNESACNVVDLGLIPGSGRSPGEGNGKPLQYSCLGNPMDRGAWRGYHPWGCKVGHDLTTEHDPCICLLMSSAQIHRRRQWQPTPVLLPGKFHGWRSLVGCSPWGR